MHTQHVSSIYLPRVTERNKKTGPTKEDEKGVISQWSLYNQFMNLKY